MIKLPSRYKKTKSAPGVGGFGSTIVCDDTELERKVIIKTINRPEDISRLTDEIQALQIAKSKNVVQIYDVIFSSSGDEIAIVEEFLSGNDLTGYRLDPANFEELYMILYQLSHGLMDIHKCGIVHRDFKLNNVKFDNENLLKIFDFGLAKYGSLPASTVGAIGTFGFMAPELFESPPVIDKPVDSYAFGATAYCLIIGRPPNCALHKPLPVALSESISDYANIDSNVAKHIDNCLNLNPSERPDFSVINSSIKRVLLYGKHRGTLTNNSNVYVVKEPGKGVRITRDSDQVAIVYNGSGFNLQDIAGDVYVNSQVATNGMKLDGSSVIILGAECLGSRRSFFAFDESHPEVVL